jgi:hypothetical protein
MKLNSVGALTSWINGGSTPRLAFRCAHVNAIGMDVETLLTLTNSEWVIYRDSFPKGQLPKVRPVTYPGVRPTLAVISSLMWPEVEPGWTILIFARDPRWLISANEWGQLFSKNQDHGITHILVTAPSQRLKDAIAVFPVRLLSIGLDDIDKAWTDTIIMVTKRSLSSEPFRIDRNDVVKGHEHLYGPGERLTKNVVPAPIRPVFAEMTPSKLDRSCLLFNEYLKAGKLS